MTGNSRISTTPNLILLLLNVLDEEVRNENGLVFSDSVDGNVGSDLVDFNTPFLIIGALAGIFVSCYFVR